MTTDILMTLRQDRRNHILPFDQGRQYMLVIHQGRVQTHQYPKAAIVAGLLAAGELRRDGDKIRLSEDS